MVLLVLVLALCAACTVSAVTGGLDTRRLLDPSSWSGPDGWFSGEDDDEELATVERVVDGDTLVADVGGRSTRVRLLNIDAPELRHGAQAEECLGPAARNALAERLPPGTSVRLVLDREHEDRYGRTLAGVYRGDALVNAEIAELGLARPVLFEPNDRFYDDVSDAYDSAEAAGRGFFDPDTHCPPPP